jgi:hypothetical protein
MLKRRDEHESKYMSLWRLRGGGYGFEGDEAGKKRVVPSVRSSISRII